MPMTASRDSVRPFPRTGVDGDVKESSRTRGSGRESERGAENPENDIICEIGLFCRFRFSGAALTPLTSSDGAEGDASVEDDPADNERELLAASAPAAAVDEEL